MIFLVWYAVVLASLSVPLYATKSRNFNRRIQGSFWKFVSADNPISTIQYFDTMSIDEKLCKCSADGDLEYVKMLVKFEDADPSYDCSRPLFLAAVNGHTELVVYFLAQKRVHEESHLVYAALKTISRGHTTIVKLLLDAIHDASRRTVSALIMKALRKRQVKIFEMLLNRYKEYLIPWDRISSECIFRDNIQVFLIALEFHSYDNHSLFMLACAEFAGEIVGHLLERFEDIQFEKDAERIIDLMIMDVDDAITPLILNDDRFHVNFDSERRLLPKLIQSDRLSSIRAYLRKDKVDFKIDNLVYAFATTGIDSTDREIELFRLLLAHSSDRSKFMLYSEPFTKQTMYYKMACLGTVPADDEKFSSVFTKLTSHFGPAEFAVRCAAKHGHWQLFREALYGLFGHVNNLLHLWKWQEDMLYDTLEFCSKSIRKSGDPKLLHFFLNRLVEKTIHRPERTNVLEQINNVVGKAHYLRLKHLEAITKGYQGYMVLETKFFRSGLDDVSRHVLEYHLFNLLIQ